MIQKVQSFFYQECTCNEFGKSYISEWVLPILNREKSVYLSLFCYSLCLLHGQCMLSSVEESMELW